MTLGKEETKSIILSFPYNSNEKLIEIMKVRVEDIRMNVEFSFKIAQGLEDIHLNIEFFLKRNS